MFKRVAGLMVLPFILVGCTEQTSLTAPTAEPLLSATTSTTVLRFDVTGGFMNPCNGEDVNVEGFVNMVIRHTINKNQVILGYHHTVHVTGTSPAGTNYLWHGSLQENVKAPLVIGAATFHFTGQDLFVSQGNAPNFLALYQVHVTVNANGEVTAEFERIGERCVG